jgi:hypothetical protein
MVHGLRASVICVVPSRCSINTLPSPICSPIWSILQHVLDPGLSENIVPQNPAVYHNFALFNGHKIEGSCIPHVWPFWKGHERSWKDKKWHVGQCWSMLVPISQRYKWWCKRCFVEYFIDLPEGSSDSTMTNMTNSLTTHRMIDLFFDAVEIHYKRCHYDLSLWRHLKSFFVMWSDLLMKSLGCLHLLSFRIGRKLECMQICVDSYSLTAT